MANAPETIDLTPNYLSVHRFSALNRDRQWDSVLRILTQLPEESKQEIFRYFNFLMLSTESAVGARIQGEGEVAMNNVREHLQRVTKQAEEAADSWECLECGRVYEQLHLDEHSPRHPSGVGCTADDCPGHWEARGVEHPQHKGVHYEDEAGVLRSPASQVPTVAVFVSGGVVQGIETNVPNLRIIKHDWDDIAAGDKRPLVPENLTPQPF
jgi:hypothetical protein